MNRPKLYLTNEVVDFIQQYNCLVINNQRDDSTNRVYWINGYFKEVEDNVYEYISETSLLEEYLKNSENNCK